MVPEETVQKVRVALRNSHQLNCCLMIENAAAPLDIEANILRRSIDVGMTLRAPEDKKSTTARLNWLLRQIKIEKNEDVFVRLLWPGKSEPTQFPLAELQKNTDIATDGKQHLSPHSFHIFVSKRIGGRFTQQSNFIVDVEQIVPEFYGNVGASLVSWRKRAPKLSNERSKAEDVTPEAIAYEAASFEG